ncbi:bisphosphate nucleotidase, putative [Pediculus humanus corporis]|uniref:Putative inositol monophosphatase 3 n=1 Tax=Pediculus humanus subsp. corporis TaxID=121224 RepID=E0VYW2_PEDHC|nr:bisphosphate nucleotidase, putative [Pediculus humanus corporis]EEB18568.1 bisphosphate nucleotidase, putative [Pediculus humanus corporis]
MNFGGKIRINKLGICIIVGAMFLFVYYMTSNKSSNLETKSVVSLKKLLIASIEATVKGGKEVVDVYKSSKLNERSKGKTKEGVNDPITDADEKSNCAMFYSLTHTFPDIKVVSEEVSSESDCRTLQTLDLDEQVLSSEVTMWIDPLDATKEFTENLLEYVTTMACVAVNGEPVIGVIHFPFGEEPKTYWGWVGKGVSEELYAKFQKKLDDSHPIVIVSRSHSGQVESIVKEAFGNSFSVIKAGGAGYKSLEVCSKNVTAYVHTSVIKKWDICAGNAIIKALGGKMTTLKNEDINYKDIKNTVNSDGILATIENHDKLIKHFKII